MNVWRLVKREIRYQKLNFAMGLLSVTAASGGLVAALTLLESHDRRTSQILDEKQAGLEQGMAEMRDDYRKISFSRFTLGWLTLGKDQLKAK